MTIIDFGFMELVKDDYYDNLKEKISEDFKDLHKDKLKRHISYLIEEHQENIDNANRRINKIKDITIKTESPQYDIETLKQKIIREQDVISHIFILLKKYQITIDPKTPVNVEKGRFRQPYYFKEKEKEIESAFENQKMKPKKLRRWIDKETEQLQFEKGIINTGINKYETSKLEN